LRFIHSKYMYALTHKSIKCAPTDPMLQGFRVSEWVVYILRCADDTLYTGVTTDLERRLAQHNNSPRGAKYTRCRRPVFPVYSERSTSRGEAQKREREIKRLEKAAKESLIAAFAATITPASRRKTARKRSDKP